MENIVNGNNIYDAKKLLRLTKDILQKVGVPQEQSEIIADSLIKANLNGIDSHGLLRLPLYVERIQRKAVNPNTSYEIVKETNSMAIIDGAHGMGPVLGTRAMKLAIKKAKQQDIAAVAVKRSHHFGAAAYYSLMAADEGMIGLAISNTPPLMPPTGGAERKLGNNPISIAVPSPMEFPIVLDMALSQAAYGKIQLAHHNKQNIPLGWGLNSSGQPTTDPGEVIESRLLSPVGGPKGYGLSFFVDILTGILINSAYGTDVNSLYNMEEYNNCGHFFIALNIEAFIPRELFQTRLKEMVLDLKNTSLAEGANEIFIPGEIEYRVSKERSKLGIPLDSETVTELKKLADQLEIVFD